MTSNALLERIKKASTIKETSALDDSEFLGRGDNFAPTYVPMLNVALSGRLGGGVSSGLTIFAGESKRFKTLFTLICAKAYLDKYGDAVLLFYDSEFGTPQSYFSTVGIDTKRVIHSPITTVEQLRSDIAKQLDELKKGDHVFIAIDSFGNLASNKEVTDAINEKSVADMTRAKSIKSLFRIITPMLTLKDIPCIAVGHTYKTMEMYARDVVSGGTGIYYSANTIFIIGRQQDKDGTDLVGYNFIINVEKSRFVKEKTKIHMGVSFEKGVDKYSGLLEAAIDLGFAAKPKLGWYAKVDHSTGEILDKMYREKETHSPEFWNDILSNPEFQEAITKRYAMGTGLMMNSDIVEGDKSTKSGKK